MESFKALFDSIDWQKGLPGSRFKTFLSGNRQLRLLELTAEFAEPQWCEKAHAGIVLDGEIEIDFRGSVVKYAEGAGILIPAGNAHKARSLTPVSRLFLAEDL